MTRRLDPKTFVADSAADLASCLARLGPSHGNSHSRGHQTRSYLIFFGPPHAASSDVNSFLGALCPGLPAIGCSAGTALADDVAIGKWVAFHVTSPYVLPQAGYVELPQSLSAPHGSQLSEAVDEFVLSFGVTDYFNQAISIRNGAHGVRYRRPAYLLLLLPGTGAPLHRPWPASNVDSHLMELLDARCSRNVSIFGGSAASATPGRGSWVACRTASGTAQVSPHAAAGLLVETDLSFGLAARHGLETDFADVHIVKELSASGYAPVVGGLRSTHPRKGHKVRVLEGPARAGYQLEGIPPPATRVPEGSPVSQHEDWHTLAILEPDRVNPNPPYNLDAGSFGFLEPVAEATGLYHAVGHPAELSNAVLAAVQHGAVSGHVKRPAAVVLVDCVGRLVHLDPVEGPGKELEQIAKALPSDAATTRFGFFGDGEVCPTDRGRNVHWQWTAVTLVLGSDFSEPYEAALKEHLLNRIDRAVVTPPSGSGRGVPIAAGASPPAFSPLPSSHLAAALDAIVEAATVLTGAPFCHIRILRHDRFEQKLVLLAGVGPVYEHAPVELSLSSNSVHQHFRSYRAFYSSPDEPYIVETRSPYSEAVAAAPGWRAEPERVAEIASGIEWWTSFQIIERNECIGILSIDSPDPRFLAESDARRRFIETAQSLANRASLPLRSTLMYGALQRALLGVSRAKSFSDLATTIIEEGQALLGYRTNLLLFLPEPTDDARNLRCVGCSGPRTRVDPEDIRVAVHAAATPVEMGVTGWVFKQKQAFVSDNAEHDADGVDGRPLFNPLLGFRGPIAEYAVPLLAGGEERRVSGPMGVLVAEAPRGILEARIHVPILEALAQACAETFDQRLWAVLRQLLPKDVCEALLDAPEMVPQSLAPPRRRVVTILYADIRGFTAIGEIVDEGRLMEFTLAYYARLAECIGKTGGTVDKFMGDGVLALFGTVEAPTLPDEEGAEERVVEGIERAIEAALDIAGQFKGLADEWLQLWRREYPGLRSEQEFELGVGIHTGRPLVGVFKAEADRHSRLTHTAIGRDVNLASRVGDLARGNAVWITATTWQYLRNAKARGRTFRFQITEAPIYAERPKGVPHVIEAFLVQRY